MRFDRKQEVIVPMSFVDDVDAVIEMIDRNNYYKIHEHTQERIDRIKSRVSEITKEQRGHIHGEATKV